MGRVMRPYEGKESALSLCHSGNYLRFRDEWDDLYEEGVTELSKEGEKAKKEPSEREKESTKCPTCGFLWPKGPIPALRVVMSG
jgi:superfamily II DNA or RNA helicase